MKAKSKKLFFIYILISLVLVIIYILGMLQSQKSPNIVTTKNVTAKEKQKPIPKPEPLPVDTYNEITLTSVGDCTLGTDERFGTTNTMPQVFNNKNKDYNYFFKNVIDIFKNDDITTANLETTFTNASIRADKEFTFKAPPDYVNILKVASIEGVNISNNHTHDYLQAGFNDTVKTLKTANVNFFGENNKWLTEVKGIKFGFLGYTGFSYNDTYLNKIKNDISELKSQGASFVAINFHWGVERSYTPNETQKYIAHFAVDNGADLIIGHHPHVVQGLEKYKGKTICYSMGNFCFGGNTNPKDKNTFIFQGKYKFKNSTLNSYQIKIIPCSISSVDYVNDYCPTPLKEKKKADLLTKINSLSPNLGFTISDEFIEVKE